MDSLIVGAVVLTAMLVTSAMLRKWLSALERNVIRLQGRVEALERKSRASSDEVPASAPQPPAHESAPIDIEPFVD
jgi:outer membrane murein-binding lipoprotein Lpp